MPETAKGATGTHHEEIVVEADRPLGKLNQCEHYDPEDGHCYNFADHVFAASYKGNVSIVAFCEEHANLEDHQ